MRKGESSFNNLNKVLIGLLIIGLISKLYNLYLNRATFENFNFMFSWTLILAFVLPLIFIYGAIKQSKFWYIVMGIWVFREFDNMWTNYVIAPLMLGTKDQYFLYNFAITLLLLGIAVIGVILYLKSFKTIKEAVE
ncbi:hypothetical protein FJZ18_04530 [Candidatus Pacearchaeota archaeon]|nr:hypothetical protein [Candidatus Pacearchaeota archaeon]